ncbi:MAG: hypothetical protein DLM50_02530 [Candidatus Meridianibacter frigidus]|nr:MAG: hypothetical protein DLM50_02530 [Candidatus Eremiobacteraeota bacterium]
MLDESAALEFANSSVKSALRSGATQCEVGISISKRFACEARAATVTKLEQSTGESLHARVFVDGRKATLSTTDLRKSSVDALLKGLVEAAQFVARDQFAGLPEAHDGLRDGVPLNLFSDELAARKAEPKLEEALELERRVRSADARIHNSNGSHFSDASTITVLANSNDFAGAYRSTRAARSCSPVADDGSTKRTGSYGTAGRHLSSLEPVADVAKKAVQRTVELFGAKKPHTMRVPVIFERDVASGVLADIFTALSGSNISNGNSWAVDRIGERIGSSVANMCDDGRLDGALGSSPFDGEGVPTGRTVVFENGVLRSYLLDTYYARKLSMKTTGNSTGGGIAPNTFYLAPGACSLEELIASTPRGVLVTDTIGFATEYATGTYSRGAHGFYIEGGERAYPIDEFTIASTFAEMLASIDAVASDLVFDSSIASPSFRVAEMTVSGN